MGKRVDPARYSRTIRRLLKHGAMKKEGYLGDLFGTPIWVQCV